jgi:hypothetical protein
MRNARKETPSKLLDCYLMSRIHAAFVSGVNWFYVITLIVFDRSKGARWFVICSLNQILLGLLNEGGSNVARVGVKSREIERPVDKEHSEQSVRGRITFQWIIERKAGRV